MEVKILRTDRLTLRQWRESDYPLFARMNSDPEVMAYYPATLDLLESNAMADKISQLIDQRGWGFWAVELRDQDRFIGFVGLHKPEYPLPFAPCVEIGWRLDKAYWGKGYATEAGREVLKFAFMELGLEAVYSFTTVTNERSCAVMQRLGMYNTQQNFLHPEISKGHPLQEHVLYKLTSEQWKKQIDGR